MSNQIQTAVMQEALDLSKLFRDNATLKNGLPTMPNRNVIADAPTVVDSSSSTSTTTTNTTSAAQSPLQAVEAAAAPIVKSGLSNFAKAGIVGAVLGTGGLGTLLGGLLNKPAPPAAPSPAITNTAPPFVPAAPVAAPATGNLIPWLQANGYSVPPK